MEYRLQKYSHSYLDSFINLLDSAFEIENKDKRGLVEWKYFDTYHQRETITYIALDEADKVVAQYTNLPVRIAHQNILFNSMICIDMTTHLNHRGKGLITKLSEKVYEEVRNNHYDFTLGFSNDEGINVDKYSRSYGYVEVGKFARYFRIAIRRKATPCRLVLVNSFETDAVFGNQTQYCRIYKDFDYLSWRYIRKPNSEYTIYQIILDKKAIGYIVLRFKENKCYIYDILINDLGKTEMINVLWSIENTALDQGIRIIVYNVLDNTFWQSLFNKYKYYKKTNNAVNYYLTIKIHNPTVSTDLLLNKDNWIIMNGDIL